MVFLLNTSFSEQENISQAIRYCLPSLQFFTGANVGSMSWCTFQIFHGNEKIVQLSTANFQLKNLDFHQERILSCFHWTLSWSIFCNQESIVWSTRSPFSNFTINNCFFQAIRYCLPSLQFFTGANVGSMSWCTFQIFHGNEKIVQLSTANFQLKNLDFHQERILSCFHWTLSWSIFCNQESIVWSTRSPFSNFTINNCFFQIPAQSVYEVLIKLI